ncbi:borneol dehydrogenase, mitochondrial-like [Magnolia sinica]|uniref:borneol dehydrogenase, mitochondrial-like n=1 Tax=Magnolia sinica TaxID=86752 RepID=UPI00265A0E9B|nr:borneol dehydrogenase, mitochondrial-like [Magnolia sinica]
MALLGRLEGKVALITGGASGIGAQTARLFHRHGAKVIIADIQDELGNSISKELSPTDTSFIHCDVQDDAHVRNAVDSAITRFGKLDIMFNNAGTVEPLKPNILDNDKADFKRVLSINVMGAFLGTKHAARVMDPARHGSMIITVSTSSVSGGATPHAYTCSKHAVVGLMKNAAVELGRFGIRVNCVSPYLVATPLVKNFYEAEDEPNLYSNLKGVVLKAEDIAEAVLFLGSDEYVRGHNLIVDGGFTITNLRSRCIHSQTKAELLTSSTVPIKMALPSPMKVIAADGVSVCESCRRWNGNPRLPPLRIQGKIPDFNCSRNSKISDADVR